MRKYFPNYALSPDKSEVQPIIKKLRKNNLKLKTLPLCDIPTTAVTCAICLIDFDFPRSHNRKFFKDAYYDP